MPAFKAMQLRDICKFGWHPLKPDNMRIWMRLLIITGSCHAPERMASCIALTQRWERTITFHNTKSTIVRT